MSEQSMYLECYIQTQENIHIFLLLYEQTANLDAVPFETNILNDHTRKP